MNNFLFGRGWVTDTLTLEAFIVLIVPTTVLLLAVISVVGRQQTVDGAAF